MPIRIKALHKRALAHIFTNAATDPGVTFNLGNAYMNFNSGNFSGFGLNMATATLCLAVRLCTEFQKAGAPLPMPKIITKLSANPGAALITSGVITTASGLEPALTFDPNKIETLYPAIIMGGLGVANILEGFVPGMKKGSALQKSFSSSAAVLYASCLTLASSNAPHWVQGIFIAGGVIGVVTAIRNRPLGPMTNAKVNALGCLSSGITNPNPTMLVANLFWASGYTALDCLLNKGGIAEAVKDSVNSITKRFKAEPVGP